MSMTETPSLNTNSTLQHNKSILSTPGPEDSGAATATTTTVRKRTRATAEQLSVLEDTFAANVSPNSKLRKELSERLQMSERSIQIWFQNRRAKVKHMQKRAQMQMQQASIRAQLYHYHHQQHQYGTHIMPLPQQVYPGDPRSSSVDSTSMHSSSSLSSPPPSTSLIPSTYPDTMDLPDYLQVGGLLSPSPSPHHDYTTSMPLLVAVPDAGPTAMLATPSLSSPSSISSSSSTSSMTPGHNQLISTPTTNPLDPMTVSPQDIWPSAHHPHQYGMRSQSVAVTSLPCADAADLQHPLERSLSNPPMTTIDPSSLMMDTTHALLPTPPPSADLYLNCTTLTIGSWHRLKLRASDLLCTFRNHCFEWQIEDAGCHFKMEIPLTSVANIDFCQDNTNHLLADVHFDISASPLFYMETAGQWVQCSDFTEGKQASRFFRHSLKGVSQQMKHDLMVLMEQCPDTRRWIRFLDQPLDFTSFYSPPPPQQQHMAWSTPYLV
ncbi:hypothetical protein [Absidia glauca]|uniref:Homeobox domain-containing protein n=1 Tax=Absidia glauca TaxID=4829 RepID=A0A168QMM3_ABSGL|nr:hypothetical protein [Absidia glauca]